MNSIRICYGYYVYNFFFLGNVIVLVINFYIIEDYKVVFLFDYVGNVEIYFV